MLKKTEKQKPVFIVSIPKAGTYLVSEICKNMGLIATEKHMRLGSLDDYSKFSDIREARKNPRKHRKAIDFEKEVKKLRRGEFAVGHLPYNEKSKVILEHCHVIFMIRDLRDCLISHMRWSIDSGRNPDPLVMNCEDKPGKLHRYLLFQGQHHVHNNYHPMMPWFYEDDVLTMRFEDFLDDKKGKQAVNDLKSFLALSDTGGEDILSKSLGAETLTKSSETSNWKEYWSDRSQELFEQLGGAILNETLGYKEK